MKKIWISLLIGILVWMPLLSVRGQTRGVGVRVKNEQTDKTEEITLYKASYALVIGVSDYTNGWQDLPGVLDDVQAVEAALQNQGFEVTKVINPTRNELRSGIESFIDKYGYDAGHRLLIYYAGHGDTGKTADGRKRGYIVPTDAPLRSKDSTGFQRTAVSMDQIELYARTIQAKHALFVFDSCFSGSLLNARRSGVPAIITYKATEPVRQFITAGTDEQEVPDKSIFREQFVAGLSGESDQNKDGYITVTELASFLQTKVTNYTRGSQTPQYGKIFDGKLDKGDFIFVSPKGTTTAENKATDKTPVKGSGIEGERAFWESIKNSTDAEDFRFYLKEYPQGVFAPVANNSLRRLSKTKTPPETNKNNSPPTNTGNTNPSTGAGNRPSGLASLATPAKTALAMHNAAKNKDMEGFKRVISKEGLAFLTASGKESGATLEDALKAGMNEPLPATVELRNEKIKGNYATLEGLAADGTWQSGQFVKEGNEWKMTIPSGSIVKNSLGMSFAYIPPGTFQMGSNNGVARADEQPIHEVSISRGYFMGIHEVTQEQWQKVMGNNPSGFQNCGQCPVEQVSWEDAQVYIKRLNSQTNDGSRYRLPTEAEWEYAARAGMTDDYNGDLKAMGWYDKNSKKKTHEVGTKQPNGWGLYDMRGNVWEWVEDWYGTYPSGSVTDPTGPTSGSHRVVRGGSWGDVDYNVRRANRYPNAPRMLTGIIGFRLVRTLD